MHTKEGPTQSQACITAIEVVSKRNTQAIFVCVGWSEYSVLSTCYHFYTISTTFSIQQTDKQQVTSAITQVARRQV